MNKRKMMALLLALMMLCAAGAQAQGPISRTIAASTATSLDNLPEAARERTDSIIFGASDLLGETNPFWVQTTGDEYLAALMYDELLFMSAQGEMGDGAATCSVSADGRTYTFTLRENLMYQDGTKVRSGDFINSFYLVLMPGYDGAYDLSRAGIVGAEEYLMGITPFISGIMPVDDQTFTITFSTASKTNLEFAALPALSVELFGSMQRPADLQPADFDAFYAERLAGVRSVNAAEKAYGQYRLSELYVSERAVLEKNETYWRGIPNVGVVEVLVVPAGEELQAILDGDVDIITMLGSVDAVDKVCDAGAGFVNLYTWMGDVVGYLGMDLENPLFSDTLTRQALACGFDRETARMNSVERYGKVPGMMLFDEFSMQADLLGEQYPYNPVRAQELLTQAGWVMGEDGVLTRDGQPFAFTLLYNSPSLIMDRVAGVMQQNYAALGIRMELEAVSFEDVLERVENEEYDMYFQARRLPASAALSVDLFVGDSHNNQSGYTSDALERMLMWVGMEQEKERQTVIYEGIYQQLYLDLPIIPMYRRNELLMVSARILNAQVTTAHSITSDVYRFILTDSLASNW